MTNRVFNIFITLSVSSLSLSFNNAYAQGSPVPGPQNSHSISAPVPNTNRITAAPPPGTKQAPAPKRTRVQINKIQNQLVGKNSLYNQLPISYEDAESRLTDLNAQLKTASPATVKNSIYSLSEWLQDVANAHWKMYKAFDKSPLTKSQAKQEKEIALRFSKLKNRAKLLKADLFIKQRRVPEALQPLVEIVCQEPRSQTGKDAYQRLVQLGFSQKAKSLELASGKGKSAKAPNK